MTKYILKRILIAIPTLLGITMIDYAIMCFAGSPLEMMQGARISQAAVAAKEAALGLDKPFLTQYFVWLGNLLHGDMGTSYISGKAVFPAFISKLPATLLLTVVSIALTIIISIPLGVLAAVKQNRFTDYLIRAASFLGNSMPNFFCSAALDVFFCYSCKDTSGYCFGSQYGKRGASQPHPCHCHVCKVSPAGTGHSFG